MGQALVHLTHTKAQGVGIESCLPGWGTLRDAPLKSVNQLWGNIFKTRVHKVLGEVAHLTDCSRLHPQHHVSGQGSACLRSEHLGSGSRRIGSSKLC